MTADEPLDPEEWNDVDTAPYEPVPLAEEPTPTAITNVVERSLISCINCDGRGWGWGGFRCPFCRGEGWIEVELPKEGQ